jgi:hypothetical protein
MITMDEIIRTKSIPAVDPQTGGLRIAPEVWIAVDILLSRLMSGTITPEEVPEPLTRNATSDLLDELEQALFALPAEDGGTGATGDSLDGLRAQWGGFRAARFFSRDDAAWLLPAFERFVCGPEMANTPRGFRVRAAFDALCPREPLAVVDKKKIQ